MASQRHKEKQKQKLLQKASQNFLSAKAIFERNEPSTIYYKDFHSLIYKMIYRFYLKLSNLKKDATKINLITYQTKIIMST